MKFGQEIQINLLEEELLVNNKKLVSVNITTYNRSFLLKRCINSVLNQNYQNLEIIVVDDCSTDKTLEVLKKYKRKDMRINFFRHKKNEGNAFARNTALKNCRGNYVAFMDDDDEWIDRDKIKKQVDIFEKSKDKNLGIVCSGIERCKANGEIKIEKATHPKDIKYEVLKGGLIHNSTVLTRKSIMTEVGAFDLNISRGVDSEFFRRLIIFHDYNVIFMNDITSKYYETSMYRMSDVYNKEVCLEHIKSQYINIKKYFFYLIFKPRTMLIRFKKSFILIFLYLRFSIFKK